MKRKARECSDPDGVSRRSELAQALVELERAIAAMEQAVRDDSMETDALRVDVLAALSHARSLYSLV